jgi:hypothetical protein
MYIGSSIDDKADIACFAVFARRKNARSRADDGVFRQSIEEPCGTSGVPTYIKKGSSRREDPCCLKPR